MVTVGTVDAILLLHCTWVGPLAPLLQEVDIQDLFGSLSSWLGNCISGGPKFAENLKRALPLCQQAFVVTGQHHQHIFSNLNS